MYSFINYILLFMLLQLSQIVPPCPLPPNSPTPSGNPHTIVHARESCMYVLWLLYSLYCTLHPHDYSVTTNLYFPITSPFLPNHLTHLPSGTHQIILCIYDSVLLLCLFCFLDSIVDKYVFIAILLFIFLLFFS